MFRRLALPVAVATALTLSACAAAGPTAEPLSTPQVTTTDASDSATEQGTTEQSAPEQSASEQGATEQSASDGASESATPGADMLSSAAASLNTGEPGLPRQSGASIDDVLRLGAVATWVEPPRVFALSLPASSDCWASAGEPVAVDGQVVVSFVQEAECAAVDSARTYTLTVPEGIDTGDTVEVAVEGLALTFTLELPGQ